MGLEIAKNCGEEKFFFDPHEGGGVHGRLLGKDNAMGKYVNNTTAVKCYFGIKPHIEPWTRVLAFLTARDR